MHSVARLFFGDSIKNVQASWPKLGPEAIPFLLNAGCNDAGGVLMKESITRAAGGEHGQAVDSALMKRLVSEANLVSKASDGARFRTRNSSSSSSTGKGEGLGKGGGGERLAVQRTTLYGRASPERVSAADRAAERKELGGEEAKETTTVAAADAEAVAASAASHAA